MSKKIISVVLAVMLMVSMISVAMVSVSATDLNESPSSADDYVITGTITGEDWNPVSGTKMTAGSFEFDGKTWPYKYDAGEQTAMTHGFKITNGKDWGDASTPADPDLKMWGKDGALGAFDNYNFTLSAACNVTVYFDPSLENGAIAVDAANLTDYKFESIIAVGGGSDPFLNGISWDPAAESNKLTEVEGQPGVYEISYEGVYEDNYQVKFAFNGSWQPKNFGTDTAGVKKGNEIKFDATFDTNPGNIEFEVPQDDSKVTLRIDLSKFDINSSTSAPVTILIEEGSDEPTTTEPTTAATDEPTTTEPTIVTEEPSTEAPVSSEGFTVNAKSNIADTVSAKYTKADKQVTVTYYLKAEKNIGNTQFNISYDPEVLEIDKATHIDEDGYEANFTPVFDKVGGTASNIMEGPGYGTFNTSSGAKPYKFTGELTDNVYLTITFNIVGNYDKDVDVLLDVRVLSAIVDGASENTKDVVDYVYQGEVMPSFYTECQTLATLSNAATPAPTEPPVAKSFKVTATSNYATSDIKAYSEDRKTVTVEYTLQAAKLIASGQWELTYDPSILKLSEAVLPNVEAVGGDYTNLTNQGKGYGNFADVSKFYDFTSEQTLAKFTFDIVGDYTKDTTINFDLVELVYAEKTGDTVTVGEYIQNGTVLDIFKAEGFGKAILDGDPVDVDPIPPETTPATPDEKPTQGPATDDQKPTQTPVTPSTPGATNPTTVPGNGTVQTSDSPMAFVLLSLLVAATGAIIVLRKRELEK